ncbi:hypothetical protein [Actinomyces sp.]
MSGGIVWDADDVSRAVNILEHSSENITSYTLEAPSGAGSNEADLAAKIERINNVIQMASFTSLAVAHGLTAASDAFAAADDQEAVNFDALQEYLRNRGAE